MRKLHISGKVDENYRYCMQALERASELVRKKQANGELVTRFHVIWNFEGFSLEQHGCLQCKSELRSSEYHNSSSHFGVHFGHASSLKKFQAFLRTSDLSQPSSDTFQEW